jgi:hypothetical protein
VSKKKHYIDEVIDAGAFIGIEMYGSTDSRSSYDIICEDRCILMKISMKVFDSMSDEYRNKMKNVCSIERHKIMDSNKNTIHSNKGKRCDMTNAINNLYYHHINTYDSRKIYKIHRIYKHMLTHI